MTHGPNAMDAAYLNKLGVNNFLVHGPDAVEPTSAMVFRPYAPDTSEWTG